MPGPEGGTSDLLSRRAWGVISRVGMERTNTVPLQCFDVATLLPPEPPSLPTLSLARPPAPSPTFP
jgi:hypothetical protein